jgi:hypothetical protein
VKLRSHQVRSLTSAVRDLCFEAGDLMIFRGSRSLHRVGPVGGERPRLTGVLCFADRPNVANSPEVRRLFWGREQ